MSPIDNEPATDIVVPNSGQAPTAVTDGSAPSPTDAPAGEDQANPAKVPATEPDWFKQRIKQITRQRGEAERRAMRLEAEVADLKKVVQQPQAKSADLRPSDFPNYDAFVEAKIDQRVTAKTEEAVRATVGSSAERDAATAAQATYNAFMSNAAEEAEAAGVDLDAVFDTLRRQPSFPQQIFELVAEADHPARLAEYLAENPGELDRVSRLGPAMAERALAKMQATFGKLKSKPNATDVPEPPPKMGGRGASPVDPEKINDMAEYKARVFDPRYAKR